MFKIMSLKDFDYISETRLYIWEKSFRVEDLFNSEIYKHQSLRSWMSELKFDRWAIGIFVTKDKFKSKSTIFRYDEIDPQRSVFGDLLDKNDLQDIEDYLKDNEGGKDVENSKDIKLRASGRNVKSKSTYFNKESKSGAGHLIEDSKFTFDGDDIYLFIFKKGSNDDMRARQLNGIVYEKSVRASFGLSSSVKGERWDAVGSLDSSYLDKKLELGKKLYLNNEELLDYNLIPQDFLKDNNNWSIKSCSSKPSASIYFADFKRISGLQKDGDKLVLVDKNLDNFILAIGFHQSGNFIEEYIVNIKLDYWRKLIPNMSNPDTINLLEKMYLELSEHRLGTAAKPGERSNKTEERWNKYCDKYRVITKDSGIKLNFKRDTKGQLRIQCSMTKSVFKQVLDNSDFILIKNK